MQRSLQKSRGQTLVLFLGFAAAMVGMSLVAFNSGQVTNAKMRAMNAADAAAYSGAVWQARTLNFQAYMNRAMVVNEVTIAQSVSLRSWVAYLDRFVTNVNYITQFVPYLGVATRAVQRGISAVDTAVQRALPFAESALRAVNAAESKAQVAADALGTIVAVDLANQVALLNGATLPTASNAALFAKNELRWMALTDDYKKTNGRVGSDRRTRMRQVTLDSRDGFSQARDWRFGIPLIVELRKQGGTDLINFDSWKGLDSAELRTIWNPLKGEWSTKVPVGWGGAQAFSPRRATAVGVHGNTNEWRDADGRLANQAANNATNAKQLVPGGLLSEFQANRDIKNPRVKDADLRLPFAVEVVVTGDKIPTANSAFQAKALLTNGTQIEHDPHYPSQNGGTYALAEACVTFSRPYGGERRDGAKEFPSLFNPYWRASLATESRASRGIVDGVKGIVPIATLVGGSGSCS